MLLWDIYAEFLGWEKEREREYLSLIYILNTRWNYYIQFHIVYHKMYIIFYEIISNRGETKIKWNCSRTAGKEVFWTLTELYTTKSYMIKCSKHLLKSNLAQLNAHILSPSPPLSLSLQPYFYLFWHKQIESYMENFNWNLQQCYLIQLLAL